MPNSATTPYTPQPGRYTGCMHYARCGRSGVLLPRISLGFWHHFGQADDFARSRALACHAFDHGVTHFDLANNYGPPPGSAEETLGRLMATDLAPYRDELFISTKAGYEMWPGPYGNWGSRKSLMASLDQSLRRMKLDYVDLFYSHRYDPETPLEETLQALVDVVRQGKALYVGLSRWPLEATKRAVACLAARDCPPLAYQGRLNMFDQAPIDDGILAYCREAGMGFVGFSPLAQGLLTDRYLQGIPADSRMAQQRFLKSDALTPQRLEQLHALNRTARAQGRTLAQMALRWVLQQEGVTTVLVGVGSVQQLDQNLQALRQA